MGTQTLLKCKNVFMQSPEEIRQAEVNRPHNFYYHFKCIGYQEVAAISCSHNHESYKRLY